MKTNISMKEWKWLNLKRKANKLSENSIELVAYTETPTQPKQLNVRNHYILLNINTTY
jgi:hypothetical protein